MKLLETYKEVLTELMGISMVSRNWSNIIDEYIKRFYESSVITINGKHHPEQYEKFKVDRFVIRLGAGINSYGLSESGYDQNNQYVVYLYFKNDKPNIDVINHEVRHAYDYYKKMESDPNVKKHSLSKEDTLLFTGDFVKFVSNRIPGFFHPFTDIFKYLYVTSKTEEKANREMILGDDPNKTYNAIKLFSNFDFKNWVYSNYSETDLKISWRQIKEKVNIPIFDKFNDYSSFIDWSDKKIRNRSQKILKKFNKVLYLKSGN